MTATGMWCLAACLYVAVARGSHAYQYYQSQVPNAGDRALGSASRVPAPFGTANVYCESVGHKDMCTGPPAHDGNPFGEAFHDAKGQWTSAVCMADSDGDGKTNGEELGDPNCVWKKGDTPERITGITHPGFKCSVAANPFCIGDAAGQGSGDDDHTHTVPSWQAAVGCAVAIFAVKYILAVVVHMRTDSSPAQPKQTNRMSKKELMDIPGEEEEEVGKAGGSPSGTAE